MTLRSGKDVVKKKKKRTFVGVLKSWGKGLKRIPNPEGCDCHAMFKNILILSVPSCFLQR